MRLNFIRTLISEMVEDSKVRDALKNGEKKALPASLVPQAPPVLTSKDKVTKRLIVVLSQASLETHKISSSGPGGDKYVLLNCDDHQGLLKKMGRDISEARPDITHQCLLTLLDSPVNKAGKLASSLYSNQSRYLNRAQSNCTNSKNLQTFFWIDGSVIA